MHQANETRLAEGLDSGAWDAEHGHLRARDSLDGALRLVISEAEPQAETVVQAS
jgi:hypothetical protein